MEEVLIPNPFLVSAVSNRNPNMKSSYFFKMKTQRYIYWQDDNMFLGYLEAYPDYWTQGETLAALEENLLDLYTELTSGTIPCVRKVAELQITA